MMSLQNIGRVFILWLWFFVLHVCCAEDKPCHKWEDIAETMTGSGRLHYCFSNKTKICTRFDCEGSLDEELLPNPVDYCFGLQVNSCLEPLSMDFYLKIPSSNYTSEYRITHDQVVELPDDKDFFQSLKDNPILKHLHLKPQLNFEFERESQDNVLLSITLVVKSAVGPFYFDEYTRKIVDEEKLPLEHCAHKTRDNSTVPPSSFHFLPCHAVKYPDQQQKMHKPAHNVTASDTIQQKCGLTQSCSLGETCQLNSNSSLEGTCQCETDFHYNTTLKACISEGMKGQECLSDTQCGWYEVCEKDTQSLSGFSCQCEEGYKWNTLRELCELDPNHRGTPHGEDKPDTGTSTNASSHHGTDHSNDGKPSSANTKYMIIGGVSAGAAILVAVVVAGLLLCRRHRRQAFPDGGGLYDSRSPMLSNNDNGDDVDLIM